MKPLTLSFKNIRSYTEFGPVSFEGRSLVGILGDTGAGKSTILEALCLALYGQSSWQGGKHEDLMADGAPHMSVDLTFAHDGHRWRVQRTYYTSTRPTMASLRNLDTGLAVDNVRAVNTTIASLLRMDFDAFRSAVLLPQGQFQKLLYSSRTDRTPLLKGIFGADLVDQVAELARTRAEQLNALVSEAQLARAGLPVDPVGDADAADADGQRFSALANELDRQHADVRGLIETARADREILAQLQQAHTRVSAATDELATADIAAEIAAAASAAEGLTEQLRQCRSNTDAARRLAQDAQNALKAANERGQGRSRIDAALALVEAMPPRAADLAQRAAEHGEEHQRLGTEAARIAELRSGVAERKTTVAGLENAAADSEEAADAASGGVTTLRDACLDALTAAASVRAAVTERQSAGTRIAELVEAVERRAANLDDARAVEAGAEANLSTLQRTAAAAVAAAGLHSGDDCPVCARALPTGWHAPDADADAKVHEAGNAVRNARAESEAAALELEQARTDLRHAEQSRDEATAKEATAREQLAAQLSRVAGATAALAAGIDTDSVIAAVGGAAGQASLPAADLLPARQVADELCRTATAYAAQLRQRAQQARAAASAAHAQLESEAKAANDAEDRLARDRTALTAARDRWQRDIAELARQLRELPGSVRATLPEIKAGTVPDWLCDTRGGPLAAATETARELSDNLVAQEKSLTEAREELDELSEVAEELRTRQEREVAGPLRAACRAVERASTPLADLTEVGVDIAMPAVPPDEPDAAAMDAYLRAVQRALSDASADLTRRSSRIKRQAARSFGKAVAGWRAALTAAAEADDDPSAAAPRDDEQALAADALTQVTVATQLARRRAEAAKTDAARARDAIDRAVALDDAIAAARARASALSGLRTSLSRSKFPAHLVARRTQVLLGLASDLFGRLSGGEFGFSDDFQVVVRRSGSVRDPKTLSGGETFLASLSLALSLVELYSRAGGRLGALFLDEGFGSLDLESLSAALDALSAETGGEKLVAVISHLHAVAEAVTDVLWVTKELGSSSAAWLEPAQVEALVTADAEAGLLS